MASSAPAPVEVHPYVPGTPFNPPSAVVLPYPIVVTPKEQHVFFIPREGFNLGGMLANPMMLMMIGLGAFMLAMPYIMVTEPYLFWGAFTSLTFFSCRKI